MAISNSAPFSVNIQTLGPHFTTQSFRCASSGTQPLFWGQAFKKGEVPAGAHVGSDQPTFTALRLSTWSDGSLRFALCAAEPVMTANTPLDIRLTQSATPAGGNNVTRAHLEARNPDVALTLSGVVTSSGAATMPDTTLSLASILSLNASHGADPSVCSAGLYDEWLSPTLSVFRYRGHFPDSHVRVYWDVYLFASGRMNVETVVEISTWWNVDGTTEATRPGQRDYHAELRVNGATRSTTLSATKVKQPHHTRWSRADWYDAAQPLVEPLYNVEYLKETRLVPNYEPGTMAATRWSVYRYTTAAEGDAPPPLGKGNWPDTMASGGEDSDFIGELLACNAAFLASGDLRGYYSTLAHARTAGRYGYHCRDELTGKVVRPLDYPRWVQSSTLHSAYYYGAPGATYSTPAPTGESLAAVCASYGWSGYALEYDWLHGPTTGYLAALLTGRFTFIDECQFQYAHAIFAYSEGSRGGASIHVAVGSEGRVPGHQLKAIAQAMAVTPDRDTAMLESMRVTVENSIDVFFGRITTGKFAGNQLGILCNGFSTNYGPSTAPSFDWISNVHLSYFAWGVIVTEALDLPISAAHHTRLREVSAQAIKPSLGRAQCDGQGYNYRRRIVYGDKVGTGSTNNSGPTAWYGSWAEVFRESRLAYAASAADTESDATGQEFLSGWTSATRVNGGTPPNGAIGFSASRCLQDLPALSRAVDLGHAGAREAYDTVRGAATFTRLATDFQIFTRRFLVKPLT